MATSNEYIEIPESFTDKMDLFKSRYRVERGKVFVTFTREYWDGRKWSTSYFADGITVPTCVGDAIADALKKGKMPTKPDTHKPCDTPSEHGYACRCDDQ